MKKISNNSRIRLYSVGILLVLGTVSTSIISWGNGNQTHWSASSVLNPLGIFGSSEGERSDGGYFTLKDNQGNILDETGINVTSGDEFITENNNRYRVTKVEGDIALCDLVGVEESAELFTANSDIAAPAAAGAAIKGTPVIGLYHSHGDESYEPSQGTSSITNGAGSGVDDVCKELENKLTSSGVKVIYDNTSHVPHDNGAYRRSRRTAAGLIKQGAQVLIDLHRDAAPAASYVGVADNKDVAKVRLVVGRQNPQEDATLGFAKQIKAQSDNLHPGLMKGIYMGKGVFNQDLSPNAILVEVGSDKTTLEEAKRGIDRFGDVVPTIVGASATGITKPGVDQRGSWKSIGWIIGILVVGVIGYLLISSGSWKGAMGKLGHFGSKEWSSFLGKNTDKKSDDQ